MSSNTIDEDVKARIMKSMYEKNGIKDPTDFSTLEYRIGNTQRSDWEFYKQSKEMERVKERMDNFSSADSLPDAIDAILKAKGNKDANDPVMDYIDSKIPSCDYSDLCGSANDGNDIPDDKEVQENSEDITEDIREVKDTDEEFVENAEDMDIEVINEPTVEEEFDENEEDMGL